MLRAVRSGCEGGTGSGGARHGSSMRGPAVADRPLLVSLGLLRRERVGCEDRHGVGIGGSWFGWREGVNGGENGKAPQRCVRWGWVSFEREAEPRRVFPGVFSRAVELIQCME